MANDKKNGQMEWIRKGLKIFDNNGTVDNVELNYNIGVDRIEITKPVYTMNINNTSYFNLKHTDTIIVGVDGDFTTLIDAVDWFNTNATQDMEIIIEAGNYKISNTITINNSNKKLHSRGRNSATTRLSSFTGLAYKPMFNIYSQVNITDLTFDGTTLSNYGTYTNENLFYFSDSELYCEFQNFQSYGFYNVFVDTVGVDLWVFNFTIDGAKNVLYMNYSTSSISTTIDFETGSFSNITITVFYFYGATETSFIIAHNVFENCNNCIQYYGDTFTLGTFTNINGCTWDGYGTFSTGFDYTRSDYRDNNIEIVNNVNISDNKPNVYLNVIDNTTTTTCTTQNIYYKVNGMIASFYIVFDVAATSGTFTITVGDQTTAAINYDATTATIQSALNNLSNVTTTSVTELTNNKDWFIKFTTAGEGYTTYSVDVSNLIGPLTARIDSNNIFEKMKIENSKITYKSKHKKNGQFFTNGNIRTTSSNQVITIAVKINNDLIYKFPISVRTTAANTPYSFSFNGYVEGIKDNDYFEFYIRNETTNNVNVIIQDMTCIFIAN